MDDRVRAFRALHFPTVLAHVNRMKHLLDHRAIADVGSNIGLFSQAICETIGYKSLALFEPCAEYFQVSQQLLGNQRDVVFYNVALGDHDEQTRIYKSKNNNLGWNTLLTEDPKQPPGFYTDMIEELVTVKKLDDFSFDTLDFIKIDVEGYENKVLEGAWETIGRHKPHLFVEVGWGTRHPHWQECAATYERLFELGYHRVEFLDTSTDVLFVPKHEPGPSIIYPW